MKGFTVIEFLLVSGLFIILLSLGTINLASTQHKSQLSSTMDTFTGDMKEQQIKAMVGDGENTNAASDYGVRFGTTQYTLFRGTYGTSNFAVSIPNTIQISTTFPNSDLIFTKGSGNVSGYTSSAAATITFRDTAYNTMLLNRFVVVMSIY